MSSSESAFKPSTSLGIIPSKKFELKSSSNRSLRCQKLEGILEVKQFEARYIFLREVVLPKHLSKVPDSRLLLSSNSYRYRRSQRLSGMESLNLLLLRYNPWSLLTLPSIGGINPFKLLLLRYKEIKLLKFPS